MYHLVAVLAIGLDEKVKARNLSKNIFESLFFLGANVDANISMKGAKKMKALSSDEKQTPNEKTA